MTKKSYQTRLPKVLPPEVPTQRTSAQSEALVSTSDVAPVASPDAAEPTSPTPPLPTDRQRTPTSPMTFVAIGLANLVLAGLVAFTIWSATKEDPPAARPGGGTAPTEAPRLMNGYESYIKTVVQPDGQIVVQQWIQTEEPLGRLRLALPSVPGAVDLSATRIEVLADGVVVDGAKQISGPAVTYTFGKTTNVQISYRLRGAVQLSDSAPGRALAMATSLDVTYSPRPQYETRVVRATEVLSLACSLSPKEPLVPCGESDGDGQWRVDLEGSGVADRVVAQVTLS